MSDASATIELSKAWMSEELTMRPLTEELGDLDSPVRQFLERRFTEGLPEVQRRYRADAPALVVPGAPKEAADQGTVEVAADWLIRFMVHLRPTLWPAAQGAMLCGQQAGLTGVLVDIHVARRPVARRARRMPRQPVCYPPGASPPAA